MAMRYCGNFAPAVRGRVSEAKAVQRKKKVGLRYKIKYEISKYEISKKRHGCDAFFAAAEAEKSVCLECLIATLLTETDIYRVKT